jgi:hypothetical protein
MADGGASYPAKTLTQACARTDFPASKLKIPEVHYENYEGSYAMAEFYFRQENWKLEI